jgi:hypothetical protein
MSTTERTGRIQRLSTETKQAFKTTEFWVMVVLVIALWIAGAVTGGDGGATAAGSETAGGGDDLNAGRVWLYTVILAGAYFISRGLSKSGSRDPYWDSPDYDGASDGIGERVKAAAQVLTEGTETGTNAEQPTRTQPGAPGR